MAKQYDRKARQEAILAMLKSNDYVSTKTMIERLDCSLSTVRSDLVSLEKDGQLVRTLGGAKPVWTSAAHQVYDRLSDQTSKKSQIARYAVEHFVPENSTIVLDAGTTAYEMACAIAEQEKHVFVLTCSLLVSMILSKCKNVRLFSFGGFYNQDGGYFSDDFISNYASIMHADTFFMGVNGVSPEVGFTITYQGEAANKDAMMKLSSKTIALCDSSKLMQNACRVISDFEKTPIIITDSGASKHAVTSLQNAGLDVIIAK